MVSGQERRAAVVPRIIRLSTAGEPRVLFPHRFKCDFVCPCFRGVIQDSCDALEGKKDGVSWANRPIGVPSCPAPSCPAAPLCTAPPRLALGVSGFWFRHFSKQSKQVAPVPKIGGPDTINQITNGWQTYGRSSQAVCQRKIIATWMIAFFFLNIFCMNYI